MSGLSHLDRRGGEEDRRSCPTVWPTLRPQQFQWPATTSHHQMSPVSSHVPTSRIPPRLSCQPQHKEDLTLQHLLSPLLFKHWQDRLQLQTLLQPVLFLLCPLFQQLPGRAEQEKRERWMRELWVPMKGGSSDQEKL